MAVQQLTVDDDREKGSLKTNKAKAIRMSTLASICRALDVTPGDLLALPDEES